jgi:hypothetical protein
MMNIQISSSTSTQSSTEEMDERNDEPSSLPGDRRRAPRNDVHASSDALRKHAIAGKLSLMHEHAELFLILF